ncbi:hypothetical protein GCM10017673_05190 [Streptosporangium violaceochromogenes]|nr:hypothetical protein GCM10017673_05190 [Streptosporangium violaceochromogenes]
MDLRRIAGAADDVLFRRPAGLLVVRPPGFLTPWLPRLPALPGGGFRVHPIRTVRLSLVIARCETLLTPAGVTFPPAT